MKQGNRVAGHFRPTLASAAVLALLATLQLTCKFDENDARSNTTIDPARIAGHEFLGRWQGKLSNKETSPAVVLVVKGDAGKLAGTCTRLALLSVGAEGELSGVGDSPIIEPQYKGTHLSFALPEPASTFIIPHAFSLTNSTEGDLSIDRVSFVLSDTEQIYGLKDLFPDREIDDFILATDPNGGLLVTVYNVVIKMRRAAQE